MNQDPVAVIWYSGDGREEWRKEIPGPSKSVDGWKFRRVAQVGYADGFGGQHIHTWDARRSCGCSIHTIYLMGKRKETYLIRCCQEHEQEGERVFRATGANQRKAVDTLVARLEKEINANADE